MGRRTASGRTLKPDPRYGSVLVSKFINCLMWDGKKTVASRIVYRALDQLKKRHPTEEPIELFCQAVEHVKPNVEVRSKRVGGATYQVPIQVRPTRAQSLAVRWLIQATRSRKGLPMHLRLADELDAASRGQGEAVTRRVNTAKMAESNKAFSHFAW